MSGPKEQQPGEFDQAKFREFSDEYGRGAWEARDPGRDEWDEPRCKVCGQPAFSPDYHDDCEMTEEPKP